MSEKTFNSAFSSWKIWLAVTLALGFASFMLFSSLNEVHFVEANKKQGTHAWKDFNKNKKIDFSIKEEFYPQKNGSFRQKTNSEFIAEISWTKQTFLFIGLAIVFMFGRDLAYMWRIKILTKDKLTWKSSFYVIMMWEFASALAPGVASGSTVAMFILNKEKIPLGKATAIVIVTTMMDNLFYILIIPLVFLFISSSALFPAENLFSSSVEFAFWMAYGIFFLLFLLLFISIFFYPHFVKHFLSFIFRLPFLKKWRNGAIKTGEEVEIAAAEFKQEKISFWLKTFLATFISWTSRYLVINCILAGFITLTLNNHIFILGKQFVLWLLMRVSPTPGGSGVAEYAFGELMTDFSDSTLLLVSLAILWRLISYFPYLIIGGIILPRWIKRT
ncbi:MAG: lysylphosphatidylglycerol synthase transmembrane domain-containing protein [Bacteroidota bacterium]